MSNTNNTSAPVTPVSDQNSFSVSEFQSDEAQQNKLSQENLRLSMRLHELEKQLLRHKAMQHAPQHDTSSNFELPSEFKSNWEKMTQDMLMNAFGEYFDRVELVVPLVQYSIMATQKTIDFAVQNKIDVVLDLFNLKYNGPQPQEQLQATLKPFIQAHYKDIFKDQALTQRIQSQLKDKIKESSYFSEQEKEQILTSLEDLQEDVLRYLDQLKQLIAYLKINDPPIVLELIEFPNRSRDVDQFKFYKFYSDSFQVIDGFEKEANPCFLVIKQPKIAKGSFAGIKPAVIMLTEVPKGFNGQLIDIKPNKREKTQGTQNDAPQVAKTKLESQEQLQLQLLSNVNCLVVPSSLRSDGEGDKHIQVIQCIHPRVTLQQISTYQTQTTSCPKTARRRVAVKRYNQVKHQSESVNCTVIDKKQLRSLNNQKGSSIAQLDRVKSQRQARNQTQQPAIKSIENNSRLTTPAKPIATPQKKESSQQCKSKRKVDENINNSRYFQCSLNFSNYLRGLVPRSPHREQSSERGIPKQHNFAQSSQAMNAFRTAADKGKMTNLTTFKSTKQKAHSKNASAITSKQIIDSKLDCSMKSNKRDQGPQLQGSPTGRKNVSKTYIEQERLAGKNFPIKERIIKQGSVLNRKQSNYRSKDCKQQSLSDSNYSFPMFGGVVKSKFTFDQPPQTNSKAKMPLVSPKAQGICRQQNK